MSIYSVIQQLRSTCKLHVRQSQLELQLRASVSPTPVPHMRYSRSKARRGMLLRPDKVAALHSGKHPTQHHRSAAAQRRGSDYLSAYLQRD